MIDPTEYLMGRDNEYPLKLEQALNMARTLACINYLRGLYNKIMKTSSGYRPGRYNIKAGGAKNSSHITCEAIDIESEPTTTITKAHPKYGHLCIKGKSFKIGDFGLWCLNNVEVLKKVGLYMEHPAFTQGWVHLQTRPTSTGNRVFVPYS